MIKSGYKIVLPVKFSLSCEKIVHSIMAFKRANDFKLIAITVCAPEADEKAEQAKLEKWLADQDIHAEAVVKKGDVAEQVVAFSKEIDASGIIINKDQPGSVNHKTIGTVSSRIIETSPVPVIVFKTDIKFDAISSILLPLDVTQENKKKISNAIFFSQFFNGALIRLMSVVFDANDYVVNRNIYQMQHLVHFIERLGCECTGEIMRCSRQEGDSISKAVVDYAERSEAEIVLLLTDDEKSPFENRLHPESAYMLANLSNNIITLTP
ncbi:MAG: universal stress protein [Bacteroidetes bacterium]|jgi:nucleotide-binding universal stress UspA family protein|nr:universal stress protein [Bacteroidota bacterium]